MSKEVQDQLSRFTRAVGGQNILEWDLKTCQVGRSMNTFWAVTLILGWSRRTYQSWSPKEGSCNGLCQELTFRAAWLDSGLPFSRTLAAGASPGESPSVFCDRSGHLCPVSADVLAKAPTLHALLDHVVEVGDAALPVLHSDTRP